MQNAWLTPIFTAFTEVVSNLQSSHEPFQLWDLNFTLSHFYLYLGKSFKKHDLPLVYIIFRTGLFLQGLSPVWLRPDLILAKGLGRETEIGFIFAEAHARVIEFVLEDKSPFNFVVVIFFIKKMNIKEWPVGLRKLAARVNGNNARDFFKSLIKNRHNSKPCDICQKNFTRITDYRNMKWGIKLKKPLKIPKLKKHEMVYKKTQALRTSMNLQVTIYVRQGEILECLYYTKQMANT